MIGFSAKLHSAVAMIRRGNVVTIINDAIALVRLQKYFHLGRNLLFTHPAENNPPESDISYAPKPFPYRLTKESDRTIIPELLRCMEGSTDYSYYSHEETVEHFEALLGQGSCVWIARDGEEIAGFFWTTTKHYLMPCGPRKLDLKLPDYAAIIEFIFVKPNYRRKGIYSRMFEEVGRRLPGVEFSCIVDSYNSASIAAQHRIGFRQNGGVWFFRCFRSYFASFRWGSTRRILFRPKKDIPYPITIR